MTRGGLVLTTCIALVFWAAFTLLLVRAFPPEPARCPDWMATHWGRCP